MSVCCAVQAYSHFLAPSLHQRLLLCYVFPGVFSRFWFRAKFFFRNSFQILWSFWLVFVCFAYAEINAKANMLSYR